MSGLISLAEHGLFPDGLTRLGIRRLIAKRLRETRAGADADPLAPLRRFADEMREGPVAPLPEKANEQHYEVPAEFFRLALGKHRKYSSCLFETGNESLDAAEAAMLRLTCERADLADGQRILELGCGWGSLTLWMGEHFPAARITAVSNSHSQRAHITEECRRRGLENIEVITCDMNDFTIGETFDRVVSVEMFEHMRNWHMLFERIAGWLKPDGRLFFHIFCHRDRAYTFETEGSDNWMGRHFFTGGIMPAEQLPRLFDEHLEVEDQWRVSGVHYARTSEAWLQNMDQNRKEILALFSRVHGDTGAKVWFHRWRMFFMACAELFGWADGEEWHVTHVRMRPRRSLA